MLSRLLLVVAMLSRASAYMVGGGTMVARAAGRVHVRTMALKTGIVGMPNVGKSTLFNALMEEAQAQAANFPFCTIEPNVGVVAVPDKKLAVLGEMNLSEKLVPTSLSFVDIAGLVEGASKGEGLGNKFLANIRECDAIVHTVRCFVDDNVIHVSGSVDPLRDIEIINLELILADLAQVDRRAQKLGKDKSATEEEKSAIAKLIAGFDEGKAARQLDLSDEELESVKGLGLLSAKPIIYAANVADEDLATGNAMVEQVRTFAATEGSSVVIVSAQVEAELVELDDEERVEFLDSLGVTKGEVGLERLIPEVYSLLNLRTYYTSGPTETKAWTIKGGWLAPQAAGVIHSDFEKGFIRAETVAYDDLVAAGSMKEAKAAGKVNAEGKEYEVKDADVLLFLFN